VQNRSRSDGARNSGIDYELYEDDFIVAELLGGDEMCWRGVADPVGLRFGGDEATAAIIFGFAEHLRDVFD
jgi:hypothetical protein